MKLRAAVALATACALPGAIAQQPAPAAPPDCPAAGEVTQHHLLGVWRAQFEGLDRGATLLLEQHAQYAQSVSGAINRDGESAQLAGDVEEGEFTLEESANGVNISATWLGDVVEGSCGREIRGNWRSEGERRSRAFVLRKQPGSR
jgi:hypothetical protein